MLDASSLDKLMRVFPTLFALKVNCIIVPFVIGSALSTENLLAFGLYETYILREFPTFIKSY